jgi:hypothetical protein
VSVAISKARLAGLIAHRDPGDPAIGDARAELKAAKLKAHVEREVSTWPPIPDAIRNELAVLLLTPAGGGDA